MAQSRTFQEMFVDVWPEVLKLLGYDALSDEEINKRLDEKALKEVERMYKAGECKEEGCYGCPFRKRLCKYTDGYEPVDADVLSLIRQLGGE